MRIEGNKSAVFNHCSLQQYHISENHLVAWFFMGTTQIKFHTQVSYYILPFSSKSKWTYQIK